MAKKKSKAPENPVPEKYMDPDVGMPNTVEIRMYCIGTGDCFVLKFYREDGTPFKMMIDCGSVRGTAKDFIPYVSDLAGYVRNEIDLLVITHEHNDHVNGFQKCKEIFSQMEIKNAWFAWTEDILAETSDLTQKRKMMKAALGSALAEIKKREQDIQKEIKESPFWVDLQLGRNAFVNGMDSLAEINLDDQTISQADATGKPLAGMTTIKDILKEKERKNKTRIWYLSPGKTISLEGLPGVRFHVLGPPQSKTQIFKEGKQGTDVYRKNMALNESVLAARAFLRFSQSPTKADLPFTEEYLSKPSKSEFGSEPLYNDDDNAWRKIDSEWLLSAGNLALRLNSHINNTSLVLAIESKDGKVLLLPGDAEYGSWESWHLIPGWENADDKRHLVEDLLSRTVFYKVAHHLSYNGTALEKGINMMPQANLVAMATLDRDRISDGWKTTMPNAYLLADLISRTGGKFFLMNEHGISPAPSATLNPNTISDGRYQEGKDNRVEGLLYKQYTLDF
jgi:beta-lactamase superfamily II metal-dependent hydrolase